jgi:GNAT superfamily N-acetyltransferase
MVGQPGRSGTADSGSGDGDGLTFRRATDDDLPVVVEVCGRALAWNGDGTDAELFLWKHRDNPFGTSPIWLAERPEGVVGVRAMMRWELCDPGGRRHPVVRAVDTATLPAHQGRGIFTRLTRAAVDDLTGEVVSAVFNTPNDRSLPGYLKLGWELIGRVPVGARPRRPAALLAMARSRVAAERWGVPTRIGLDPVEALADDEAVEVALGRCPRPRGWSTPLTVEYLRWRTGFAPLANRIQLLGSSPADGFIVFRLRRRGALTQLSLLHVVAPPSAPLGRTIRRLLSDTGADVALASGARLGLTAGLVPLPGTGPILAWRRLASQSVPSRAELSLPLGAVELF